jgi:hypothetical protein
VAAFRRLIEEPGLLRDLATQASLTMTRNWAAACDELVERLAAVIEKNRSHQTGTATSNKTAGNAYEKMPSADAE